MKKRILPKLASLPKYEPVEEEFICFWCNKKTKEPTKDHIIPRWLGGKSVRTCCAICNNERSRISNLARSISKKLEGNFTNALKTVAPLLIKYKKLIKKKLKGQELLICLNEISIIEMDQSMNHLLQENQNES